MRARGFTLIEVMVALAVVAIALPALLVSLYQQVDSTAYLRDKSMAHLVAANKLVELRVLSRATESLVRGKDNGVEQMADREWHWWLDKQPTEVPQFFRIEIRVAQGEEQREQPLYTLVAFLNADLASEAEAGPAEESGPGSETATQPATEPGDAGV